MKNYELFELKVMTSLGNEYSSYLFISYFNDSYKCSRCY